MVRERGFILTGVFLLQGYLPANMERRKLTLQRKREEYFGFIQQYYDSRNEEHHQDTYRQVRTLCLWPGFCLPSTPVLPLGVMVGLSLDVAIGNRASCFCPSSYGY